MASKPAIAKAVSLIYASRGREVPPDMVLPAYEHVLRECTDYQLLMAADYDARNGGTFPATAGELLRKARQYAPSEAAQIAKREAIDAAIASASVPRIGKS